MMKSLSFLTRPFTLLDERRHQWILVLFSTVFGVLFINIFVPFNINRWSNDSGVAQLLRLSGFGLIAGMVLAVSQFFLRPLLGFRRFSTLNFICWFIGEMLLMAFFFLLYQSPESRLPELFNDLGDSIGFTFPAVLIPYGLALLLISAMKDRVRLLEIKDIGGQGRTGTELLNFPDEKGVIRFSVAAGQILYLEAADNYVFVYYLSGEQVFRQILRNSMKNAETVLADFPFKRCHRSFIVNLRKIEFIEHSKTSSFIKLAGMEKHIPVSRKFYPAFKTYGDEIASESGLSQ